MGALSLDDRRQLFAEEIAAVTQLDAPALLAAFGRVPREGFLGDGPWQIYNGLDRSYGTTSDADPRHLYHDVVVAIDPARELNNGQPSSLARWLAALEPAPGQRLLHVGCGTGYYTAILAEVVGPTGRIVGYEADPGLAERARVNLAAWPQATAIAGDASALDGRFDAIFINAGCTYARPEWLAATDRLVLPLTIHIPSYQQGVGGMMRLDRAGARWAMKVVSQAGIYDCVNARDPAHEPILRKLLAPGTRITALDPTPHEQGPACLAHIDGFCVQ